MRGQILLVCALLMIGSCATRQKPAQPKPPSIERFILPWTVSPYAQFCVEQAPGFGDCIAVGDLRKLLRSMGKA